MIISTTLGIRVRQTPRLHVDPEALYNQNIQWAKGQAAYIVRDRGSTWPIETQRDWQAELLTELWFAYKRYTPERGQWRSWAYTIMVSRLTQLIDSAIRQRKRDDTARQQGRYALEATTLDPCSLALDSAVLESVKSNLREMADAEAREAFRRDATVLDYIALSGAEHGTWAHLEQAIGTDRAGVLRCRSRIAEAMIAAGLYGGEEAG